MAEPETLEDTFRVEIASLSDEGQEDVLDAIEADPTMTREEADALIHRTEDADDRRENFDALQHEQEKEMEAGDWETARDRAQEAEYEMREVEDLGGDAEAEIHEAHNDVAEIDDAIDKDDMAAQDAHDAADYAAHGMDGAADVYGESATEHAVDSAEAADAGSPNEYNPDHDVDADHDSVYE